MFDELAPGVFRRRYESLDINIGVVVSDVGVLIVDTRATHAEADVLRDELRSLTSLPVRWVVDTHWHWDHTFGNSRFPGTDIWGHRLCREAMLVRGESMKDAAIRWLPDQVDELRSVVIAPPTQVFDTRVQIDLGSKSVTLAYHGLGHTDSDVAISVDGHDVTFLGDLVEEGSPPYFDDGYPLVWPLALGSALAEGAGIVVPGHGDVMSRAMTLTQLEELESVASIARSCIDDGVPVNEAAAMGPYPDEVMLVALTRALETGTQLS